MPQIQSIHTVYRPQPTVPTTPAPGANAGATWPTQPTQPTDNYGAYPGYGTTPSYPGYGQTPGYGQVPGYGQAPTYPGYPTTPGYPGYPTGPAPASNGLLGTLVTGAFAGLRAIGGVAYKVTRRTRSRNSYNSGSPRGWGSSYSTRGVRSSGRRTTGGAKVGMKGDFGARMVGAVRSSVIVGTILSVVTNGWDLIQKRQTFAQAGSNVVGDVMSSAVGGLGGAVASSVGTAMLAGIVGTGFGATIAAVGLGIAGYAITDYFFRKTSFFQNVTAKTHQILA